MSFERWFGWMFWSNLIVGLGLMAMAILNGCGYIEGVPAWVTGGAVVNFVSALFSFVMMEREQNGN